MTGLITGQAAVDELLRVLDLEQLEINMFRGIGPEVKPQRTFGGEVAGQALVAAGRTVDSHRTVHSLHGYFVRPGDSTKPIIYIVDRIRDGRSFSVRRTQAIQNGQPIFFMSASFHIGDKGLSHARAASVDVPRPDQVPSLSELLAGNPERLASWVQSPRPIDVRYVGASGFAVSGERPPAPEQQVWMRADGKLPDDPLLHVCVLTYASDMTLLDTVLNQHGQVWGVGGYAGASLDHALWFHAPFRADEWMLYDSVSPWAGNGRGLATGQFFTADGTHIATAVQEGLLRHVPQSPNRD